jgi:DnaJ-class molecular chaperone
MTIETFTLIECPTCGGDGEFNEGPHPTMTCPTCRGKGRIEEERRLVDEDDLDGLPAPSEEARAG